ncbi:helix-turn-helix domain-containing protein [Granulibacter bethesdensis]|uniref:helix-turn-helix domain-containing protein n=1 Tax=Granulibacter bethesdensis TaxID=364410 RepID=UPI0003F20D2F|nr:helix-turn-helix transcriptional regulator [Granulibacter bethesdensis]AHJ69364.1 Transcriptional regulator, Cro/CI family [Granulibacter bethesdensis]
MSPTETIFSQQKFVTYGDTRSAPICKKNYMGTSFNDRLKKTRQQKKISQIEVAEAVGISRSFLSDIENGNKDGSFKTIAALADYYNVSLDYIKDGSSPSVLRNPDNIAHDDHERVLLRLWRLIGDDERKSLLILLRAGMNTRGNAA